MRFHILVTPVPEEPAILSPEEARAGLQWLKSMHANGILTAVEAWPSDPKGTPNRRIGGGYMIAEVSSREALDDFLSGYPIIHTINTVINQAIPLDDGFTPLFDAIDEHAHA